MKEKHKDREALFSHALFVKQWRIILLLLYFAAQSNALINDPVQQSTSMLNWTANPSLMFYHAYFDISFNVGGNLVQADNNALY